MVTGDNIEAVISEKLGRKTSLRLSLGSRLPAVGCLKSVEILTCAGRQAIEGFEKGSGDSHYVRGRIIADGEAHFYFALVDANEVCLFSGDEDSVQALFAMCRKEIGSEKLRRNGSGLRTLKAMFRSEESSVVVVPVGGSAATPKRNHKCPCGSGQKYKYCCGR